MATFEDTLLNKYFYRFLPKILITMDIISDRKRTNPFISDFTSQRKFWVLL